jgi:hypothetical protein
MVLLPERPIPSWPIAALGERALPLRYPGRIVTETAHSHQQSHGNCAAIEARISSDLLATFPYFSKKFNAAFEEAPRRWRRQKNSAAATRAFGP